MTAASLTPPRTAVLHRRIRIVVAITITWNIIEAVIAAGGVVEPSSTRTGHWKVYLDGESLGGIAGTPGDWRALRNDIARLRRGGLNITSKGKYRGTAAQD